MSARLIITGFLVGPIWQPGFKCYKPLTYDVRAQQRRTVGKMDMRDHLLAATQDGDFQSVSIALGELRAVRPDKPDRVWPLERFADIADMLHTDPDWAPQHWEESEEFADVE